jgi:hypothetical protein
MLRGLAGTREHRIIPSGKIGGGTDKLRISPYYKEDELAGVGPVTAREREGLNTLKICPALVAEALVPRLAYYEETEQR